MIDIFNNNPTIAELEDLFSYNMADDTLAAGFSLKPIPVSDYDKISDDEKLYDLAKLLEKREEKEAAGEIWAKIPDLYRQWRQGHDNKMIATEG